MTTTRRARGEGAIYRDDDTGRWHGQLDLGRGPDGKRRRRKVTGKTKAEVSRKMRELRKAEAEGADLSLKSATVAKVIEQWLSTATGGKAPSTMERVRRRLNDHVIPGVGHYRIDQLRPEHVEQWLAAEAATGQARRTISDYRADLRQVLNWAMRRRVITWNPAALADLPQGAKEERQRRSFTPEQASALLGALDAERLGPYFTVLLLLGLRPGEADALAWTAVDLEAGTVTISRAMQRGDGGAPLDIGPTKTKQVRVLHMPAAVVAAFRRQRAQQAAERLAAGAGWSNDPRWDGLAFTSELGTPVHPSNVRRSFTKSCARADVPTLTVYELRHSAASLLIAAGVAPYDVADMLGHTDTRMLDRHYRHKVNPTVRGHVAAMDALAGVK